MASNASRVSCPLYLAGSLAMAGCEQAPAPPRVAPEPWPASIEEQFQSAEARRHAIEQWKAGQADIDRLGVKGRPPGPRQ